MLHAIIFDISPVHGVAKASMKKYLGGAGVVQQAVVIDRNVAPVWCKGFYMGSSLMIRPTVLIQILHLLICFLTSIIIVSKKIITMSFNKKDGVAT